MSASETEILPDGRIDVLARWHSRPYMTSHRASRVGQRSARRRVPPVIRSESSTASLPMAVTR